MTANEHITSALFALLSEKQYDDITVTDICKKAGYTRMSFYRNFNSKEKILSKAFQSSFQKFIGDQENNKDISVFFNFYMDNKELISNIYKAGKQQLIIDQLFTILGYSDELPLELQYSVSYFSYTFFSFLDTWFKRGMIETPEQIQTIMSNNTQ